MWFSHQIHLQNLKPVRQKRKILLFFPLQVIQNKEKKNGRYFLHIILCNGTPYIPQRGAWRKMAKITSLYSVGNWIQQKSAYPANLLPRNVWMKELCCCHLPSLPHSTYWKRYYTCNNLTLTKQPCRFLLVHFCITRASLLGQYAVPWSLDPRSTMMIGAFAAQEITNL